MQKTVFRVMLTALVLATAVAGGGQGAGAATEDLAKQLANPIADLISLPLQYNYDTNYGANDEGTKHLLNIQPVWPFAITPEWNLITRTIVPLVSVDDVPAGVDESGLGDILQSLWFSPKATVGGWMVGLGPVLLYPTASDDALGGGKWGAGPTVIGLRQTGPWTYGALANHVWSFAGDDDRADISSTFLQPFLAYVTKTMTTISLNTESTYDWEREQWSVPLNFMVAQLLQAGKMPLSLQAGVRYWAEAPDGGPEDFGFRAVVTFIFPK